jgi:hypothetical protein
LRAKPTRVSVNSLACIYARISLIPLLTARVKFASGQWYEEKAFVLNEPERSAYLEDAKRLILKAAKDLAKLGMTMESADAVAFLQRLGETNIPTDLLELLDERYGEVTARS